MRFGSVMAHDSCALAFGIQLCECRICLHVLVTVGRSAPWHMQLLVRSREDVIVATVPYAAERVRNEGYLGALLRTPSDAVRYAYIMSEAVLGARRSWLSVAQTESGRQPLRAATTLRS